MYFVLVTPSGICSLCKTRAAYIRNSPASESNLGSFCHIILTRSTVLYFPWVPSGVTPGEAMCRGHCSTGGTLRVGYLPLNNALSTGPPLYRIHLHTTTMLHSYSCINLDSIECVQVHPCELYSVSHVCHHMLIAAKCELPG
jgi:hypothetical protein